MKSRTVILTLFHWYCLTFKYISLFILYSVYTWLLNTVKQITSSIRSFNLELYVKFIAINIWKVLLKSNLIIIRDDLLFDHYYKMKILFWVKYTKFIVMVKKGSFLTFLSSKKFRIWDILKKVYFWCYYLD